MNVLYVMGSSAAAAASARRLQVAAPLQRLVACIMPRDTLRQAGEQDLVKNWVMAACVVQYFAKRLVGWLLRRRMFACMSCKPPGSLSTLVSCHPQGGPAGDLQPESRTQGDSASSSGAPAPAGAMADNPKSLPYPTAAPAGGHASPASDAAMGQPYPYSWPAAPTNGHAAGGGEGQDKGRVRAGDRDSRERRRDRDADARSRRRDSGRARDGDKDSDKRSRCASSNTGKDCGSFILPHSTWQGGAASGAHIQATFWRSRLGSVCRR